MTTDPAAAAGWSVPVEVVRSPGGIPAWLITDRSVPVLALNFAFLDAGAGGDPAGHEGLSAMAAGLLTQGAGELSATLFQDRLREQAISIGFSAGRETVSGSLRTLSANVAEAAELLALCLTRPRFDATEIERARASRRIAVRNDATSPRAVAGQLWWNSAFPGHPFARPPIGTDAGLAAIDRAALSGFAATRLSRRRLVVAAAGAIDAAGLGRLLDQAFGALPEAAPPPVDIPGAPNPFGLAVQRLAAPQTAASFGQAALATDDPAWEAQLVTTRILAGGGFAGRLMEEVREKRGLSYGIGAQIVPFGPRSTLVLGAVSTDNARFGETLSVLRDTWSGFARGGPTPDELEDAKAYLAGSFPLQFTATPDIARSLVSLQLLRRPPDWLEGRLRRLAAVDLDLARSTAARLFDPAGLAVAAAGEPAGV